MPKQRSFLGWRIPRFTPRKLIYFLLAFSALAIIFTSALGASVSNSPRIATSTRKIASKLKVVPVPDSLTKSRLNPFRQPSHPPSRQKDDSFQGSSWWSDWKWVTTPFSSSVTLDDDRALLPPPPRRAPIYCYYDATVKKSREEKDAESDILLTWRRAWWAAGFQPLILSAAEAMNNPLYQEIQKWDMQDGLKAELMRWLAWDNMGGGLLSHYTLVPMARRNRYSLSYLREGEYRQLTRWAALDNGLYAGKGSEVTAVLKDLMDPKILAAASTIVSAIHEDRFAVDNADAVPLAYYSAKTIEKRYKKVAETAQQSRAKGLKSLNTLINAHLQSTWQSHFEGIEVVKPHPEHMTSIVTDGVRLANALVQCPTSPLPASCPPNIHDCTPCVARSPIRVTTPARYQNSSSVFTLGTVPHPWTFTCLDQMRSDFNITWIRRQSSRDVWLDEVTRELLGSGVSSDLRVVKLKESVAGEEGLGHSLWYTAESGLPRDADWHLGFAIHSHGLDTGKALSPVPADRLPKKVKGPDPERVNGPKASEEDLLQEQPILENAKRVVALTKSTDETKLRASLEAWNLGDTEAWKFVGAWQARRKMERENWEKGERKYSAGSGSEMGRTALSRWRDESNE